LRKVTASITPGALHLAERSALLSRVWRRWRLLRERVEWRLRFLRERRDAFLVPDRIIAVSPARIGGIARGAFARGRHLFPATISGDWDLTARPTDDGLYDDLNDFRAVAAGSGWESTGLYSREMERFGRDGPSGGFVDRHEFASACCAQYYRLLSSISANGYMLQSRLPRQGPRGYASVDPHEVTVAIGRAGSLLVREGRHRVACATVLGVPEIPARVAFRHSEWMVVRRRIEMHAHTHGGRIPQPLLHPDLDNIPARRDCHAEFAWVRRALQSQAGSLVDLTPQWGYYCHQFEQLGFACTAVVDGSENAWFLRTLRQAEARAFSVVTVDDLAAPRSFDVALALDWVRADGNAAVSAERLLELMGSVEVRELVIEVPAAPSVPLDETRVDHRVGLLDVLAEKGGFSTRSYVFSPGPRSHVYHLVRG
jgi:hypothetical protein